MNIHCQAYQFTEYLDVVGTMMDSKYINISET